MVHSHQLQGKIVDNKILEDFMKYCTYPKTRNGLGNRSQSVLRDVNALQYNNEKGYSIDPDRINDSILKEAALVLSNYNKRMNDTQKSKVQKKQNHDIVQPTLFDKSDKPEQERPIVTANDQLMQRIEAMEAQLSKIITFFKSL